MQIESIRIHGYRSLADTELAPREFTALVGPNNAGKSNIVDALDFLASVYASGIKHAIDLKGGFENISFRENGVSQREMSFELRVSGSRDDIRRIPLYSPEPEPEEFGATTATMRLRLRHRFTIRGHGSPLVSNYEIAQEELEISRGLDNMAPLLRAVRKGQRFDVDFEAPSADRWLGIFPPLLASEFESPFSRIMSAGESPRELSIRMLATLSTVTRDFVEHLGKMRAFRLFPPACRRPTAPTPLANLSTYGDNLPALVYHLQEQSPQSWAKVMESMALILPDLEEIDVLPTPDRLWTLDFREAGIENRWTSDEVSDGTIRALALFTSLYDPRYSLLAIEEPENSLHPWALRVLVSACRQASQRPESKQVLLTTHSPALIDQLTPAEVAVVWKERGRTSLAPLTAMEPGLEASWLDGEFKLSSLLDSGLVQQAVPTP